jgi:hypothetical protein
MAAPTKPANVKKALANSEPSTHGTKPTCLYVRYLVAIGGEADIIGSLRAFPLLTHSGHRPAFHVAAEKPV